MKNLIYIPATRGLDQELPFGIKTWKFYCSKYSIDLVVSKESVKDNREVYKNDNFQQYFVDTLLTLEYDRVLIVDCDTMIRWDAPNIFELYPKDTFTVVRDVSGYHSGKYHLDQWLFFNPNIKTPPKDYFNSGFVLLSKNNYLKLREAMLPYYNYYIDVKQNNSLRIDTSDQTPTNIIAYDLFSEDIKYLSDIWNNMVMFKYDDASFINDSYVWHFTGPKLGGWENKHILMEQIWNHVNPHYNLKQPLQDLNTQLT